MHAAVAGWTNKTLCRTHERANLLRLRLLHQNKMPPFVADRTTYQNNKNDGNAIAVLGSIHGDVYFPGGPSPDQCLRDLRVTNPKEDKTRIEDDKDK